jgi:hypothetical protein
MITFLRTVLYWCSMAIASMCGIAALTITVAIVTNKLPDPQAWTAVMFFTAVGVVAGIACHATSIRDGGSDYMT